MKVFLIKKTKETDQMQFTFDWFLDRWEKQNNFGIVEEIQVLDSI